MNGIAFSLRLTLNTERALDLFYPKGIGTFICRRCDLGHETVEEFLNHFEAAHCPDLTDEEFRQRLYSNSHFCGRCDFRTTEKVPDSFVLDKIGVPV